MLTGLVSSSEPELWLLWVLPDVLAEDTLFSKERRENRPSPIHLSVRRSFLPAWDRHNFCHTFMESDTQRGRKRAASHVRALSGHAVLLRTMAPSIFVAGSPAQTPHFFHAGLCLPSEAAPHALQRVC